MSGAGSAGAQTSASRTGRAVAWTGLFLIGLILPRLIRMSADRVHIEDDNYLYSAYLIHRGQTPYLDFVQANPPLLEQLTAPLFAVFGPDYRVGEALTALAVLATAAAFWRLGCRLYGPAAGIGAALLYSWMPLVFRYHLYEREIFSLAAASAGLALAFSGRGGAALRAGLGSGMLLPCAAGVLLGAAFHCKQVGLFPAAALVLFGSASGQARAALVAGTAFVAFSGGLLGLDLLLYGPDVALQSFLLHLIKGSPIPLEVRLQRLGAELGPLLPAAALGLWTRRHERGTLLLGLWALFELLFMLLLSSTFWPHYLLPLLGPLTLLAGGGLSSGPRPGRRAALALLAGAALLLWQARRDPLDRLGFSGVGRQDLLRTARLVAQLVPPHSDALMCPPVLALQADRIKMYNYIDTLGFTRQLQAAYRDGRLRRFLSELPAESFGRTLARANATWLPEALEAIRSGRVLAVVPEGELPIPVGALVASGYRPLERNPWFEVYASPAAVSPDP